MLANPKEGDSAPDITCWLLLLYYDHKWSLGKHGIRAFSLSFLVWQNIHFDWSVSERREIYICVFIYIERERRREKVASSVWGYVFSTLRTLSHGFEDMLHSPRLPTVQHHNSNNTPLTTSKLQVNPVYMSMCKQSMWWAKKGRIGYLLTKT